MSPKRLEQQETNAQGHRKQRMNIALQKLRKQTTYSIDKGTYLIEK
jgi:hypothetical protein